MIFIMTSLLLSCNEKIKSHAESVYSRHLQEHVPLQVFTTPLQSKENVSLLLVSGNLASIDKTKNVLLSLYKTNKINSSVIINISTEKINISDERSLEKYYSFINKELLPFIKKKSGIRKFQTMSIAGIKQNGEIAIGFAWENADKIEKGIAVSSFTDTSYNWIIQQIENSRKRPNCSMILYEGIEKNYTDSSYVYKILSGKKSLQAVEYIRYSGKDNQEFWDELLPEIFMKTLGD